MDNQPGSESRSLAATVFLGLALILALDVGMRRVLAPPAPRDASAPAEDFSAARALATLDALAPGDLARTPRPSGSRANAEVRENLLQVLRERGYEPQVQYAYACSSWEGCGVVRNVLAHVAGPPEGEGVLLVAHYDSVPAGPGIADDLAGVATLLEVLRARRENGPPDFPVRLLITDGEERGLIGARAFARDHPWMGSTAFVINVEARGTCGATTLFQTGAGNWRVIERYAEGAQQPSTNSVGIEVYRRMPNDTDLTVLLAARPVQAANFAFIGGVSRYHTPLDDREHLDPASVQHQGGEVLGLLRALRSEDMVLSQGLPDAIFASLGGAFVVSWPLAWNLPLAGLCLALSLGALVRALARRSLSVLDLAAGAGAVLLALGLAVLLGRAALLLVRAYSGVDAPWTLSPAPLRGTLYAAGFLGALLPGSLLRRPGLRLAALHAATIAWSAAALGSALYAPGASVIFVPTALLAAGVAWSVGSSPRGLGGWRALALLAPALLSVPFMAPLSSGLEEAFGHALPEGTTGIVALGALFLLPLAGGMARLARLLMLALGQGAWIAGVLATLTLPPYGASAPSHLNGLHRVAAGADAAPGVAPVPSPRLTLLSEAPLGPPASLEVGRRLTLRVQPVPGSVETTLLVGGELLETRAHGVALDAFNRSGPGGRTQVRLFGVDEQGLELELYLAGNAPVAIEVVDLLPGLPPGAHLERPTWSVPRGYGDLTEVRSSFDL